MKKGIVMFFVFFLFFSDFLSSQDFEVAPVVLNFKTEPGAIESKKITVRNHADKKQAFVLKLSDYEIDSMGKKQRLPPGKSKRSCANWISLNPSFFELNPNEKTEVEVIMAVPEDGFTSRWGVLSVQATTEQTFQEVDKVVATGIVVSPRIAVMIFQSPKSNSNYKAVIRSFNEVVKTGAKQREFNVEVVNVGDKEIKANVYLMLSNIQTAEESKVANATETLLPGTKKVFTLKIPAETPKGKYALAALLDYGHGTPLEGSQLIIEQE